MTMKNIEELKRMADERDRIDKMISPVLSDLALIAVIYNSFKQKHKIIRDKKHNGYWEKRVFIFVIIRFFSPATIFGGERIKNGVRQELSRLLNISEASISIICGKMAFTYETYNSFKTEAERLINEIAGEFNLK